MLGLMAEIIKKFDASKTIKIGIYDGNTSSGAPGNCVSSIKGNVFKADITLQTSYFTNSSKESAITILIHEFVHAYIRSSGSDILTTSHHEQMTAKYIDPMASYLKDQFGISLKEAYALAWSGVADSNALKNATEDTVFPMSDGDKITRNEIILLSVPYKDNNPEFMKGHKICN